RGLWPGKQRLSVRLSPRRIAAGETAEVFLSPEKTGPKFFRLPGVLVRYQINLETRDGRSLVYLFDPRRAGTEPKTFEVTERGAYFSEYDELVFFDVLGFFRLSRRFFLEHEPRILAGPRRAEERLPLRIRSGGTEQRSDVHYLRTDNLIDHRPYIPGDDPRRINWKLYSHGGSLFVREGEPEPPPHSRLLILVDTQADSFLFSLAAEARRAVDLLCENALAAALEYAEAGRDILIGHTGGKIRGGPAADLAEALAWPAALSLSAPEDYPAPGEDRGCLILALPRSAGESSALDRFLKKRDPKQQVDVVFLYEDDGFRNSGKGAAASKVPALSAAAETNVYIYGQKPGVHAGAFCCGGMTPAGAQERGGGYE
ncbi:MAG: DUF58 domain-containing protein, partial [Treponema sp.]|nr:DUF58 domain-containing protein [Treponema sp.]